MKILALDLSTKRSGWATIDENEELKYGVIASAAADVEKRIGVMRDELRKIIDTYKPEVIVMEEVKQDGYNNHTGKVLMWLQGIISVMVYEYDKHITVEYIGPSSWRSVLGIQGYRIKRDAQKVLDINYANKTYGLSLGNDQDDEADAIGILTAKSKGLQPATPQKLGKIGGDDSAF